MNLMHNAAVHEAGHIVVSYLVGFSPRSVKITTTGDGGCQIDYGDLENIARIMMAMDICPQFFSILSQLNSDAVLDLAKRLCCILIAGGIAESIYRDGLDFSGKSDIELIGPDLTRAQAISDHYGIQLVEEMKSIYLFLANRKTWGAVTALKDAILNSTNNELDALAIDRISECSGYKAFLQE